MEIILNIIKKIIPNRLFKALQPCYHFIFSYLAALFYSFPSEKLIVIGVTGTTGKTTSVYLIAKMFESAGIKTGFTSTAIFNDGKKEWNNDKKMTMLGRFFTQKLLRNMLRNKCRVAIVETTSEGIRQFRHRFINYDIAVFTGLYEEHIDSHGSFKNYKKAKGQLFEHLKKSKTKYIDNNRRVVAPKSGFKKIDLNRVKKTIIANGDDEYADYFLQFVADRKIVYSNDENKNFKDNFKVINYSGLKSDASGVSFKVLNMKLKLKMLGAFNAINAMNAISVGFALDLNKQAIKKGVESVTGVAGRLEKINEGQNFIAIVDYAFEPKALKKLYDVLDKIPHKNIVHVLGSAGGGRDLARRPKLGEIAGKKAKYAIVTNEDPYDDDPEIIIDQVALGAENVGKKINFDLFKILDRKQAIKKALSLVEDNDILIITGKGNEQAICVANSKKIPWDDREVLKKIIRNKK
ncbi:MAG: UDP-N-acetylmuramyl-tripeptide synthetase [Patescibacteria group bacterium]|nr:UDP-N-acetylmuramyl-tripeptide synthetase [Patescibacteria group bacterium]